MTLCNMTNDTNVFETEISRFGPNVQLTYYYHGARTACTLHDAHGAFTNVLLHGRSEHAYTLRTTATEPTGDRPRLIII